MVTIGGAESAPPRGKEDILKAVGIRVKDHFLKWPDTFPDWCDQGLGDWGAVPEAEGLTEEAKDTVVGIGDGLGIEAGLGTEDGAGTMLGE